MINDLPFWDSLQKHIEHTETGGSLYKGAGMVTIYIKLPLIIISYRIQACNNHIHKCFKLHFEMKL